MKKLRKISEPEVVAEFLKAEYYRTEFDHDREQFEKLVYLPDLTNEQENALRRLLLFRRRGAMWRELPPDVEWWDIEPEEQDFERINVFPRAQWRTISDGNFQALHVAGRIHQQLEAGKTNSLLAKIKVLKTRLQYEGPKSTVMLIGIDETQPVTLLEGNHRFVSSLLLPREIMLRRLRLICGFSPNMKKCCWYKTDFFNLIHYAKNRIKHFWDREADLAELLPRAGQAARAQGMAVQSAVPAENLNNVNS
ncbi:MAG TPA: hypothetical protein VG649_16775 [Candidatus Angelobacter sp.]|jgi:hypothetical protein|nr:hypothetical protein [Candidatus Angelobacter sp.]